MKKEIELCRYCTDSTPLTECVVQEHWERRLKACNLPTNTTVSNPPRLDVEMEIDGERVRVERLSPLTGDHESMPDRSSLPVGWHSPTSGDVEARKGQTTYRDINIFERCASPRYNSAGSQIGVSR